MKCPYCNDTGKYKKPNDEKEFERIIDIEMEKADFTNYKKASDFAYKKVGYSFIDCPYCHNKKV